MPPYGEPDWATPGDTTNVATTTTTTPTSPGVVTPAPQNIDSAAVRNNARLVVFALSILNLGLAAMMGALGLIAIVRYKPKKFDDLTQAFLSVYMTIFAALLFLYEFIWWQPVAKLNIMFRKNFGFFYGLKGKGFYLIFIAFLTIGLMDDNQLQNNIEGLDWATGIGWLAGGLLHLFVACTKPEVNQVYRPPTVGLSTIGQPQEAGDVEQGPQI